MGRIIQFYKKAKKRFYRGPKNMGALKVPKFVGYQSFTLTALYWLNYYINTQLTMVGRIMILIGSMMVSYCLLDPYVFPMSYLGFTLVAMYIINIVVGFIFRPKVEIKRTLPEQAICGSLVPVTYTVQNNGRLPCWDIKLDAISYPGTSKDSVVSINALAPGQNSKESSTIRFQHRGIFLLPSAYVESSFPFGLWKWGKFGKGNREIKVLPKPITISNINIPFLMGENSLDYLQSQQGNGMEFASCREFRYGDNPKHIHWNSWAKTGVPIVREMTNEGKPAVSIYFDPCFKVNALSKYTDIQKDFELSVSFLAGVCQYLSLQNSCIRNFIVDDEYMNFNDSDPQKIYEKILTKCADIEEMREIKELELSHFLMDKISTTRGLIMILQNLDDSRLKTINTLSEMGTPIKVFLLGKKEPSAKGNFSFIEYSNLQKGTVELI